VISILGPDTSVAAIVREAQARGEVVDVVWSGADKAEALARFGEVLHLPHWFGHNLDALADCLHDLAGRRAMPALLVWDGVAALRDSDPDTYEAICAVLDEVAEDHPSFTAAVIER
jgi:RNAse (barnase) inhibitor barstar